MRKLKTIIGLMLGLTVSAAASAQSLQSQMDTMFGQMSNVTKPGVVNGAQRGVVTGGSIDIRSPVMQQQNLTNLSPPGITAGCGGIDLYGGSFSYISGQQFVQMLRSVASNAEGLAFQMALEAMSNQLSQHLTAFTNLMHEGVMSMKNSCAIAQEGLVRTGAAGAISSFGTQVGQGISTELGYQSDSSAAIGADTPSNPIINALASSNPAITNQLMYMNMVWQALNTNQQSFTFSLGGGGSTLSQEEMSITGTIIVCQVGVDPNCSPSNSPDSTAAGGYSIKFIPPSIHLQDLVYGSTTTSGSSSGVQYLKCDDASRCMNPSPTPWSNEGYITLVNNTLGVSGPNQGILGAMLNGTTLTSQQQAFASAVGPSYALIMDVGSQNPNAVYGYAQHIAQPLALELAYQHGIAIFNLVTSALQNVQSPGKAQLMDDINKVRQQWMEDHKEMQTQDDMDVNFSDLAKVYLEHSENYNPYSTQGLQAQ